MNSLRSTLVSLLAKKRFRFPPIAWEYVKPYFSQFGEDVAVEMFLNNKKNGFYVDVGAFHPLELSNTYKLYARFHWRGINIEPNREQFVLFEKHRPRDINVHAAVSGAEGEWDYYRFETPTFNTISKTQADQLRKQGLACTVEKIRVFPLAAILAKHLPPGQGIDLLTVDCEGHDIEVLASNDWNRYRPMLVLVEDHSEEAVTPVVNYMQGNGYAFVNWVGLTKIFKDQRPSA
jgi:FkbM family methyltransferase